MAWVYDPNGNLTWQPDTVGPAPLTNPNPNRQPINPNAPNQNPVANAVGAAGSVLPAAPGIPQQPTAPATTAVQVPNAVDIAPAGSAAAGGTQQQPTQQVQPNALGAPQGSNGTYTVQQITAASDVEVQQANENAARLWAQIQPLQQQATQLNTELQQTPDPTKQATLNAITQQLNGLYTNLAAAQNTLAQANDRRANALNSAQKNGIIDPAQADLFAAETDKAKADSAFARQQADVLTNGAQGQRDLVAAQAGYQNAQAAALKQTAPAQADYYNNLAKQASAQADTITKQGGVYVAQAAQIDALTGPQSDYYKGQAAAAQAQSRLDDAQTADLKARGPAQVALLGSQANLANAQAVNQLSAAGTNLLGPMYGLQDRLNAIRGIYDQYFGTGSGLSPDEATRQANQALQDYVTASVAGTTPYAAAVAAENAGLTAFGTQAALANQAQQAAASRANALMGFGGSALSTLAQMNANAPAGSTAGAAAYMELMRMMAAQSGQGVFAPPTQPTAPQLPGILQRFAAPGGLPPTAGGAVANAGSATAPNSGTQPININITQPQGTGQPPTTAPTTSFAPPAGGYAARQPGTYGALTGSLPGMLQQYAPASSDSVQRLWANELGSGAVQMPGTF
jgi:hypothetical protein